MLDPGSQSSSLRKVSFAFSSHRWVQPWPDCRASSKSLFDHVDQLCRPPPDYMHHLLQEVQDGGFPNETTWSLDPKDWHPAFGTRRGSTEKEGPSQREGSGKKEQKEERVGFGSCRRGLALMRVASDRIFHRTVVEYSFCRPTNIYIYICIMDCDVRA